METIHEAHCQLCGSTDREDVGFGSYSGCCNERIIRNMPAQHCDPAECHHQ